MKVNKTLWRWSRLLHVYAAVALLLLLSFFAVTGITLNHPDWFSGQTEEHDIEFQLPNFNTNNDLNFKPEQIRIIEQQLNVNFSQLKFERDGDLAFIDAQMPGSFINAELDLNTGQVAASITSFGTWAWLNDLHKGRHTSISWRWLLDISSVLILLFCFSGLVLLLPNRRHLKPAMYLGLLTALICAGVIVYF